MLPYLLLEMLHQFHHRKPISPERLRLARSELNLSILFFSKNTPTAPTGNRPLQPLEAQFYHWELSYYPFFSCVQRRAHPGRGKTYPRKNQPWRNGRKWPIKPIGIRENSRDNRRKRRVQTCSNILSKPLINKANPLLFCFFVRCSGKQSQLTLCRLQPRALMCVA